MRRNDVFGDLGVMSLFEYRMGQIAASGHLIDHHSSNEKVSRYQFPHFPKNTDYYENNQISFTSCIRDMIPSRRSRRRRYTSTC